MRAPCGGCTSGKPPQEARTPLLKELGQRKAVGARELLVFFVPKKRITGCIGFHPLILYPFYPLTLLISFWGSALVEAFMGHRLHAPYIILSAHAHAHACYPPGIPPR